MKEYYIRPNKYDENSVVIFSYVHPPYMESIEYIFCKEAFHEFTGCEIPKLGEIYKIKSVHIHTEDVTPKPSNKGSWWKNLLKIIKLYTNRKN